MKKILITGMSGLIGGAVRRQLEGRYDLTALNRRDVPGVRCFQADIADLESIRPSFAGQDVVVHLSAVVRMDAAWEELLQANVVGTYNVFEAARQAGVQRVIFASSGSTIGGYGHQFPYNALLEGRYEEAPNPWPMITHELPTHPASIYGCSKVWGEALAHHFADTTDLSMLCLRFGVVNQTDRPTDIRHFPIWCSQRDGAQMVERCIEAPDDLKFDIFFVTSNNKWGYRDLSHAREVVGYAPQDNAEDYR